MQNRTAIILSLGMLMEKVDTSPFINHMLAKAKDENPEFLFTPELQKQTFLLAEYFNLGKVDSDTYAIKTLQVLGIKNMQIEEFWSHWNAVVTVGDVTKQIDLLKDISREHNGIVYLLTDSNSKHIKKIRKECEEQNISFLKSKPMLLGQFPLYTSYQIGKNRQELLKYIVEDIRSKEFNKADSLKLILCNPENIKDPTHRAIAQKECDAMMAWCDTQNVAVTLHGSSLSETLGNIFNLQNATENRFSLA